MDKIDYRGLIHGVDKYPCVLLRKGKLCCCFLSHLGLLSPKWKFFDSKSAQTYHGILQISEAMQISVLGPRLILSVREQYNAELVAEFDEGASITSTVVFQECVDVPTCGGVSFMYGLNGTSLVSPQFDVGRNLAWQEDELRSMRKWCMEDKLKVEDRDAQGGRELAAKLAGMMIQLAPTAAQLFVPNLIGPQRSQFRASSPANMSTEPSPTVSKISLYIEMEQLYYFDESGQGIGFELEMEQCM
ncbi:hypothetical protein BD769DRAFT_1677400 [Suillus cothurnatus]|nr:hypothetical protein BD769DRAFT_1677400 [Suillus cothurnatus]